MTSNRVGLAGLPSIAQMMNRSNSGHIRALRAYRDDTTMVGPSAPDSSVRGAMTIIRTLRRWECIDGDSLTERGRELLAALEQRESAWLAKLGGMS